jgi:predicted RNase H-like HicB family nuclease
MTVHKQEKVLQYTAVFEPAEEGGYVVFVPALPGCASQGETFEEAQQNIREALEGYLATLHEAGDDIPEESKNTIISRVLTSLPE